MSAVSLVLVAMLCVLPAGAAVAAGPAEAPAPVPQGMTMRVTQEMRALGTPTSLNAVLHLLPPDKFRIEGSLHYTELDIEGTFMAASDGKEVRQYVKTPFTTQAVSVDLGKVHEHVPDYAPADDHNPMAFARLLDSVPERTPLPSVGLDGVECLGFAFSPKGVALPLSSQLLLDTERLATVRVWYNHKDTVARRVEYVDAADQVLIRLTCEAVRTGVEIPPETFRVEWPEGVQPQDRTAAVIERQLRRKQAPDPATPPAGEVEPQ